MDREILTLRVASENESVIQVRDIWFTAKVLLCALTVYSGFQVAYLITDLASCNLAQYVLKSSLLDEKRAAKLVYQARCFSAVVLTFKDFAGNSTHARMRNSP